MGIFSQLGGLFLAAVPTVIFVFIFYFFLRWSFFTPIQKILAERHRRAEGARHDAEALRADAHEKSRSYSEALRKARGEMFAEQEAARHRVLEERQAAIQAARASAQLKLQEGKQALAADVEKARTQLENSGDTLAAEIAKTILAGGPAPKTPSPTVPVGAQ
jgi:F0F1-type ATP synthase membrane subunit b/b'